MRTQEGQGLEEGRTQGLSLGRQAAKFCVSRASLRRELGEQEEKEGGKEPEREL